MHLLARIRATPCKDIANSLQGLWRLFAYREMSQCLFLVLKRKNKLLNCLLSIRWLCEIGVFFVVICLKTLIPHAH